MVICNCTKGKGTPLLLVLSLEIPPVRVVHYIVHELVNGMDDYRNGSQAHGSWDRFLQDLGSLEHFQKTTSAPTYTVDRKSWQDDRGQRLPEEHITSSYNRLAGTTTQGRWRPVDSPGFGVSVRYTISGSYNVGGIYQGPADQWPESLAKLIGIAQVTHGGVPEQVLGLVELVLQCGRNLVHCNCKYKEMCYSEGDIS